MKLKMNREALKKFFKEIAIALLILFVISNVFSYLRKPVLQDEALPSAVFQTIEEKELDFKSYEGKPLLVHFWATWCPVCRMETANIERVSKKYQVVTVAVQSGSDSEIKAFMKEKEASFAVINDGSGELSKRFSVEVFPTTFIYDGKGKLIFTEVGYSTTAGLLARMAWAEKE